MRAIQLQRPGADLVAVELPDPEPGEGQVLVEVHAAGICHSDAHYRRQGFGVRLPRTLGHEIAGVVAGVGPGVRDLRPGDRVAVHYLVSCGACPECRTAGEQFCRNGGMIGKDLDGGFAERVLVPARNAVPIPAGVPTATAAVMMCSTSTAYHALQLGGAGPGRSAAIVGFGGLGLSALRLARLLGCDPVLVVDRVEEKLERARGLGAIPLHPDRRPLPEAVREATDGRGVDLALDLAGVPELCTAALRSLAPGGRLVLVALLERRFEFDPYRDLIGREASIVGCSDHLLGDLRRLLELAGDGSLPLDDAITRTVPLDAAGVNAVLDDLDAGSRHFRSVIVRDP